MIRLTIEEDLKDLGMTKGRGKISEVFEKDESEKDGNKEGNDKRDGRRSFFSERLRRDRDRRFGLKKDDEFEEELNDESEEDLEEGLRLGRRAGKKIGKRRHKMSAAERTKERIYARKRRRNPKVSRKLTAYRKLYTKRFGEKLKRASESFERGIRLGVKKGVFTEDKLENINTLYEDIETCNMEELIEEIVTVADLLVDQLREIKGTKYQELANVLEEEVEKFYRLMESEDDDNFSDREVVEKTMQMVGSIGDCFVIYVKNKKRN